MSKDLPATLVDDVDNAQDVPGAIEFRVLPDENEPCGIAFLCPCGCGHQSWLPLQDRPSVSWRWDGNREAPTLIPSVLMTTPCRWHGWLRSGVWVSC